MRNREEYVNDEDVDLEAAEMAGWRQGMFDKCNGLPYRTFPLITDTCLFNTIWFMGYDVGYTENEVKV